MITANPRAPRSRRADRFDRFSPLLDRGTAPLAFEAGDANLYRYVGNSPTNYVDPSGLEWDVVRSKDEPYARVTAEQGDTLNDLAALVGLDPKQMSSWLTYAEWARSPRIAYYTNNPSEPLPAGATFFVPNTVGAVWCGDLGGTGRGVAGFNRWRDYMEELGFHVETRYLGERGTTRDSLLDWFQKTSSEKTLHGLFVYGHGDAEGFGSNKHEIFLKYKDVADKLNYQLGYTHLAVCDGGWSTADNPKTTTKGQIPFLRYILKHYKPNPSGPATIDAGGKDLVSGTDGHKFSGLKGIQFPLVNDGWIDRILDPLIEPGEQGTRKRK